MLFGMIERGMGGMVLGDKGKPRGNLNPGAERSSDSGGEAMWAVVLTKELWKKGVWFVQVFFGTATMISKLNQCRDDAKSVAIVALGCFHPVTKVQSASLHFFLGGDKESEDSEDESEDDVGSKAQ